MIPHALLIKGIGYGLVGVLIAGAGWKAYSWVRDEIIEKENLQTQLSNEQISHERTQHELSSLKLTQELDEKHKKEIAIIKENHAEERAAMRAEIESAKAVLTDRERLSKVSIGRPTLVAKLANRATQRVFNDLETIYNE